MTNETQPNIILITETEGLSETQPQVPSDEETPKKTSKFFGPAFWLSLLVLIIALGLGGMAGYNKGVSERVNAKSTLVAQQLVEQFDLVQKDIDARRYSVARQRLEYIIGQDAGFPGATGKLAEVLVQQAITPSPVPTATATITPTPDLRSQEAIFSQAQQQLDAKDWSAVMGSLDSLRKADSAYKAAVVDGMYFLALRNRGMDQILGVGAYQTTNMEGGIYDLTLAERFGPLDGYADGLRSFTRMYIIGASFWDVNWPQAVNYFRQVTSYAPNLRDASNVTANQRLYQALLKYGDQVSGVAKKKDRCQALDIWSEAGNIAALNNEYSNKYSQLDTDCHPPTEVPTQEPDPGLEITPTP
ncbi:MAG: hypothetical protein WCK35_03835 [Chloroflexota bacterium]